MLEELNLPKIVVGTNILEQVKAESYINHCHFWSYNGDQLKQKYQLLLHAPPRMSIDNMRNVSAKIALEVEADYLMFLDDDVIIPKDTLLKFIHTMNYYSDISILASLTYTRGYPYKPMLFKTTEDGYNLRTYLDFENDIDKNGLVDCGAVGFACAILRCSDLKKVELPYFLTGTQHTEDVYYCIKVRDELEGRRIVCDTSIQTQHLLHPAAVSHSNHKFMRKMDEEIYELKEDEHDRGEEYLVKCKQAKLKPVQV